MINKCPLGRSLHPIYKTCILLIRKIWKNMQFIDTLDIDPPPPSLEKTDTFNTLHPKEFRHSLWKVLFKLFPSPFPGLPSEIFPFPIRRLISQKTLLSSLLYFRRKGKEFLYQNIELMIETKKTSPFLKQTKFFRTEGFTSGNARS